MITDTDLAALRVAAALVHAVPGLRARVRQDRRTIVEIRTPDDEVTDASPVIAPCEFRSAVGRAHRGGAEHPLAGVGLGRADAFAIDIGTPSGGAARPGGLYRVTHGAHHVWVFGSTLDAEVAHPLGQDLVDAALPLEGVVALGLRPDAATDVTIAYAHLHAPAGSTAEDALVDLLEALLARWTTHELLASVTRAASPEG